MKATIILKKPPLGKWPRLQVGTSGIVVLFTNPFTGTVVGCPNQSNPIGYHTDEWSGDSFKDFHGTVTLEND